MAIPVPQRAAAEEGSRAATLPLTLPVVLGHGRLFTNDFIGDGHDSWRTGSYHWSVILGRDWQGRPPQGFPGLIELRLRSEIIAPRRVGSSGADRPYVGQLSAGLHSHSALGPFDLSLGSDLVLLGPQTRLSELQTRFHDTFGFSGPNGTEYQIADEVLVGAIAELALPLRLTPRLTLRPFAELQVGTEDLARAGFEVILGAVGHEDLLVRDIATGHLIRAVEGDALGFGLVAGADWTQVSGSTYLPENAGYRAEEQRWRARFGTHVQLGSDISFFYGITYLSEEFVGQPEGQRLGSLRLSFAF